MSVDLPATNTVVRQPFAVEGWALDAGSLQGDGVDVVRDLQVDTTLPGWNAFAVTKEPGRTAPKVPGSSPVADGTIDA